MITIASLANILSINSNDILEINEVVTNNIVRIYVKLRPKNNACPGCGSNKIQFKEWKTRIIKHALFLNKETVFILKERRYRCLNCKRTFNETNPFAFKRSRLTHEMVYTILEKLRDFNITYKNVANDLKISDTTVINVFDRYVNQKRRKLSRVISIDECYNKDQFNKPYSAIMFDFLDNKIIDIVEDRSKYNLSNYFSKITEHERKNVEYIVIDMWAPYLELAQIYFPNAVIAIDSFHVLQNISRALDSVRRRIMKKYHHVEYSKEYYFLKKWNYVLFKEFPIYGEKVKMYRTHEWLNEYQIQQIIYDIHPDIKNASQYYLKYKRLNKISNKEMFTEFIEDFINDESIANIPEMIPVIQMLTNWKEWILNSFIVVDGRRLSNGPIEGFNSNFKKLLCVENGAFSFLRFRNRLIYCYNKPNCYTPLSEIIPKRSRGKRGKYKKTIKS